MPSRESFLIVTNSISIPVSEVALVAVRSSGPGGQNVNKVNSQMQLRWNVMESDALPQRVHERFTSLQRRRISKDGIFQLSSQRYRDQEKNRQDCLDRLKELVLQATIIPKTRKPTKVPRGVKEARLRDKKSRAATKQNRRPPAHD